MIKPICLFLRWVMRNHSQNKSQKITLCRDYYRQRVTSKYNLIVPYQNDYGKSCCSFLMINGGRRIIF